MKSRHFMCLLLFLVSFIKGIYSADTFNIKHEMVGSSTIQTSKKGGALKLPNQDLSFAEYQLPILGVSTIAPLISEPGWAVFSVLMPLMNYWADTSPYMNPDSQIGVKEWTTYASILGFGLYNLHIHDRSYLSSFIGNFFVLNFITVIHKFIVPVSDQELEM